MTISRLFITVQFTWPKKKKKNHQCNLHNCNRRQACIPMTIPRSQSNVDLADTEGCLQHN